MAAPRKRVPKADPAQAQAGVEHVEAVQDNLPLLDDMPLLLSIELGRSRSTLDQVAGLGEQSLVELDKPVGEPVDIRLNGKLFARGEVVTVDECFGVRITEVLGAAGPEAGHGG